MNIQDLLTIAGAITNPAQLSKLLLKQMRNKDPQMATLLNNMIDSGAKPQDALVKFTKEGKITSGQLTQLKQYYAMAKKMGLKLTIPKSAFDEAEKLIKENEGKSTFNGF